MTPDTRHKANMKMGKHTHEDVRCIYFLLKHVDFLKSYSMLVDRAVIIFEVISAKQKKTLFALLDPPHMDDLNHHLEKQQLPRLEKNIMFFLRFPLQINTK